MRTLHNLVCVAALVASYILLFPHALNAESVSVEITADHLAIEGQPILIEDDFRNWHHAGPVLIPESIMYPKNGGKVVDVLFFYTTALANVQTLETIQERADEAVAYLNLALANSGVTHRVRACGVQGLQEIEFVETGDLSTDLEQIQHPANEWLDTMGCDTGVAFIDAPQHPGLGNAGMAAVTTNPERSTAVLWPQVSAHAIAHEFGHNALCLHNVEDEGQVFNYEGIGRHGHWDFDPLSTDEFGSGGAFGTIMNASCPEAVEAGKACLQVPYFSNPEVRLHDVPTGAKHVSECALLLELRMEAMAGYREKSTCVANDTTLCLNRERFKVEIVWQDFVGTVGEGHALSVPGSADSGLFWFFGPENLEMLIKVLDACELNDRYWVFFAATTNVAFTVTVTDTETGEVKEYFNPLNATAVATTDTDAFETCP